MYGRTNRSLPPSQHITNNTRQKGAFLDLNKGMTTVKNRHFENTNEELQFAKFVNKFETTNKGTASQQKLHKPLAHKDPISQTHMDFHTEVGYLFYHKLKRIKKGSPLYNLTTMGFRPSKVDRDLNQDEIIQKKNQGEFHDLKRASERAWKPCVR